jgi:hypothetical protein
MSSEFIAANRITAARLVNSAIAHLDRGNIIGAAPLVEKALMLPGAIMRKEAAHLLTRLGCELKRNNLDCWARHCLFRALDYFEDWNGTELRVGDSGPMVHSFAIHSLGITFANRIQSYQFIDQANNRHSERDLPGAIE